MNFQKFYFANVWCHLCISHAVHHIFYTNAEPIVIDVNRPRAQDQVDIGQLRAVPVDDEPMRNASASAKLAQPVDKVQVEGRSQPIVIDVNRPRAQDQVDIGQLRAVPVDDEPMRNALRPNSHNRWTKYKSKGGARYEIPYIISGSYSHNELKTIRRAMSAIAKNTCVVFRKRNANAHANFVDIRNAPNQGCYTMVGMVPGHNTLMLESSSLQTCITPATVVHELLHKVGLWHEQMRYDRDRYIKVHYENIPKDLHQQFHRVPNSMSTTYGVRYDYRSVMHYAKDAFAAAPGRITMQTKETKYQNVIGKARAASRGDWTKVCAMYACARCMGKPFSSSGKSRQQLNSAPLQIAENADIGSSSRNSRLRSLHELLQKMKAEKEVLAEKLRRMRTEKEMPAAEHQDEDGQR